MTTKEIISEAFIDSYSGCCPVVFPSRIGDIKVELSSYNKETGVMNWIASFSALDVLYRID